MEFTNNISLAEYISKNSATQSVRIQQEVALHIYLLKCRDNSFSDAGITLRFNPVSSQLNIVIPDLLSFPSEKLCSSKIFLLKL